ncbi:hypothetical protein KJ713_01295 [Patescibacteria group bacterium]|nr:hypothetical protein [Patescibacteria group bacterium]
MLAQITVDKKAVRNKFFTYRVPENLRVKPGSLVLVPFHGQRVVGVINSVHQDKPMRFKIKKIESIIYPQSLLSQNQIKLAGFIAKKYFAPISSVIFAILPQYLRRIKRPPAASRQQTAKQKAGSWKLEAGSCNNYLLLDPENKYTLKIYQKAVKKTLSRGQNVLLLVPDLSIDLVQQIKLFSKKSLVLNKDDYTDKEIFLKWQMIREGKFDLVIGSHLALFAPLGNLGLIIVHQERNQYYKNEQSPKYHLREAAFEMARLNRANLILQAEIPSLESYLALKNKKLKLIPFRNFPTKLKSKNKIKIIDLKQERGLLSLKTLKTIEVNLKKKKKTLLFLNRKGFSRFCICSDCGFSKHLESQESAPALCPDCQSTNGREHSFGTRRLEFELKKLFPKAKIIRFDKESNKISDFDIIITTSYIFKLNQVFDTTIIILAEIGLSLPNFRSEEELFYTLFRALNLGREKIIQTFYPEHRIIKYLLKDDFKTFADEELKLRQENGYPPFTTLIRLTYEGNNAKKEATKLAGLLNKLNQSYNSPNEILGPAPVFIQPAGLSRTKVRDLPRAAARNLKYEIILKGKNPYPLLSLVPDKWKVDVEPVELLK